MSAPCRDTLIQWMRDGWFAGEPTLLLEYIASRAYSDGRFDERNEHAPASVIINATSPDIGDELRAAMGDVRYGAMLPEPVDQSIEALIAAARAEEREACAKVCDSIRQHLLPDGQQSKACEALLCASEAIRARGAA